LLLDSNVILRVYQEDHPQHGTALFAISLLAADGVRLCVLPQILVEFWAVSTRPVLALNGLGFSTEQAVFAVETIKENLTLLEDTGSLFERWQLLVAKHRVSGKATHDARIVAAMLEHGETSILSFNQADFTRYPNINVVHPGDVCSKARLL
jgi:predicted nucleic acid-binding protein